MTNENTTQEAPATEAPAKTRGPNGYKEGLERAKLSRRTLRERARAKRKVRLATDKEFAKTYFEGRQKRAASKKVAYRKRHAKKTTA